MSTDEDYFDKCLMRLIRVGVQPYHAYEICKEYDRNNDYAGLLELVALQEVLNYDDTRQFVD